MSTLCSKLLIKARNLLIVQFTLFTTLSTGAEFQVELDKGLSQPTNVITIAGNIESGDYIKFIDASKQALKLNEEINGAMIVRLNSEGGNLLEAMRIGRAIRAMKMDTSIGGKWVYNNLLPVGSKSSCMSACFFILVAGLHRDGPFEFSGGGTNTPLGIHRPAFEPNYFSGLSTDNAQREYSKLIEESKRYLEEMGVSDYLVNKIFTTPSSKVYLISSKEFEEQVGNVAYFQEWLISKCGNGLTADENRDFSVNVTEEALKRESTFSDGYTKYLKEKIANGARLGLISEC